MRMSGILGFLKFWLNYMAHFKKLLKILRHQSSQSVGEDTEAPQWLASPGTLDKSSISHATQPSRQPQPHVCSVLRVQYIWTCGDGAMWGDLCGECCVLHNRKENRFLLCEIEAVRITTKWNWSAVLTFYYFTTPGLINNLWHLTWKSDFLLTFQQEKIEMQLQSYFVYDWISSWLPNDLCSSEKKWPVVTFPLAECSLWMS